ncbi:hypothetical protein Hanom_Chr13g01183391 [Helianthus anomalus]
MPIQPNHLFPWLLVFVVNRKTLPSAIRFLSFPSNNRTRRATTASSVHHKPHVLLQQPGPSWTKIRTTSHVHNKRCCKLRCNRDPSWIYHIPCGCTQWSVWRRVIIH